MNDLFLLKEFIKETLLDENKKKKSKKKEYPGDPDYYVGLSDRQFIKRTNI